ncbi:transcriptional regulator gntR family protein [mine drainage metagenome]|uniref:Transcriptional regulator gntR family protein n=1 Tax=mine drainage metagenome TaxID=410659 RepID=T1A9Y0_9ZZZZ
MAKQPNWDDREPIYRQLRDRLAAMILDQNVREGDALPSVRSMAADFQLNPLTVLKSYQGLVDEGVIEKHRGLGMYLAPGGRERLLERERRRFLEHDWPALIQTIERLGLDPKTLVDSLTTKLRPE